MKKIHLIKKFKFESAHQMRNDDFSEKNNEKYFGKCQNVHGHNYELEVMISGTITRSKGYFVNLYDFSSNVQSRIIDVIDHQMLNDIIPGYKHLPVTLEVLSSWIWNEISKKLPQYNLEKIRLWETSENSVEIYK